MKTCKECGIEKAKTSFSKNRGICKPCRSQAQRKFYNDNHERYLLTNRAYYQKNKERISRYKKDYNLKNPEKLRDKNLRYLYGITAAEVDCMAQEQNSRCRICNQEKPLHVDHCHETKEVRGLLCSECNRGLGHFYDSPTLLNAAIRYLTPNTE